MFSSLIFKHLNLWKEWSQIYIFWQFQYKLPWLEQVKNIEWFCLGRAKKVKSKHWRKFCLYCQTVSQQQSLQRLVFHLHHLCPPPTTQICINWPPTKSFLLPLFRHCFVWWQCGKWGCQKIFKSKQLYLRKFHIISNIAIEYIILFFSEKLIGLPII